MTGPSPVDDLLERLGRGEIPETARMAAARGALPLPPPDLLRLQAHLAIHDVEEGVRQAAAEALTSRDTAETCDLLGAKDLAAEVAEFYAGTPDAPPEILGALAANPVCPDALVAGFAASAGIDVVESLLLNQVRLIRAPAVLEALEANPRLRAGQRDRLAEVRKHFLEPPPEAGPIEPATAAKMGTAILEAEEEEQVLGAAAAPGEDDEAEATPEEEEVQEERQTSTLNRIMALTPAEKIKLAFCGTGEERYILVRDRNKVISSSVLKSPKTNEKDVERFVRMRSLSDDIMRMIAANREWMRNYAVVVGLVRNPKTPPGISMAQLQRVNNNDMKMLQLDRNIPEVLRQQAKKIFRARANPKSRKH